MIARIKVCSDVNLDQLSHFGAHAMQCMCSSQHEEEVSFHILLTSATSHVIAHRKQSIICSPHGFASLLVCLYFVLTVLFFFIWSFLNLFYFFLPLLTFVCNIHFCSRFEFHLRL